MAKTSTSGHACRPLADRPTWCVVDVHIAASEDDEIERLRLAGAALWLEAVGHEPTQGTYLARVVDLGRGVDRWCAVDASARERARELITRDQRRVVTKWLAASARRRPRDEWRPTGAPHHCPACQHSELCLADLWRLGQHDQRSGARA